MATKPTSIDDSFRAVTPEEIASYQKFGWVKLKNFIPRAKVDELLSMAKDRMGENGDRDLPPEAFTYFNPLTLRGLKHPLMGPIIEHCGRGARGSAFAISPISSRLNSPQRRNRRIAAALADRTGIRTTRLRPRTDPAAWYFGRR
jgi:hypothetical protein